MEEKIQKLSEGMDFIEEATSWTNEALSFQEANEITISEAKGETKSPYKILGKACGCFAPIGEFSRNKRLYSDDLWPTVLANEEFSSRLAHRAVFGCISHEDKLVDDVDIREGKVSHIVTKLEIREDLNNKPYLYGELEILDTPAGRILEAMYKGGADLYVSSRAAGKLIPVPGQNYSLVRPEQYHVHCFDVVCRPGFLQARPAFEAVSVEPVQHAVSESLPITTSDACITAAPIEESTSEVAELKGQIDKLAKIIEKVVDDVYEVDETKTGTKNPQELYEELLNSDEVSEEMFENLEATLKEANANLYNSIVENSRQKFNKEHGEKSGLEIEYYRFGGKHPYKIVNKGTDYFAAPYDAPKYRTLKQAQKHILDTYNKPKDETKISEAMEDFLKLLSETNITDEAVSDIFDIMFNKKEGNE